MTAKDARAANRFISEFAGSLAKMHGPSIDYILLAGSAARGDFMIGDSDIDISVMARSEEGRAKMEADALALYWELDLKHGLRLREVYDKKKASAFPLFAKDARTRPFGVLSPCPIRQRSAFWFLSSAFGFYEEIMAHALRHGQVVYGRDILSDPRLIAAISKPRILTYSFFISLAAVPLFFIFPDWAFQRSVRAVLFAFDDQFEALGRASAPAHSRQEEAWCISFAHEALRLRGCLRGGGRMPPWRSRLGFCLRSPLHILAHNIERVYLAGRKSNGR